MALITDQRHFIQAEEHFLIGMYAFGCHRPCVLQVGVQHNHADNRTEERVAAEHFGRRERDQDRQEGISHIGKQIGKHEQRAGAVERDKAVVNHELERLHDAHEEARSHNRRNDRHKNIAQRLDRALEPVALLRRLRLGLILADRRRARLRDELIVHLVDRTGAIDNLQLSLRLKYALHARCIFERILIHLFVVRNHQSQTRCAMCRRDHIVLSADASEHLESRFSIIHLYSTLSTYL